MMKNLIGVLKENTPTIRQIVFKIGTRQAIQFPRITIADNRYTRSMRKVICKERRRYLYVIMT
ncbi:hypothetical protein D3C74_293420 [compost metagenome]